MLWQQKQAGFTLIELMIVTAVIAIIAAVGYPSYTKYVERSKRSEARAALMDAAARLERFYSDNNAYATAANTFPPAAGIVTTSENNHYQLTITTATPFQTFTLSAAPQTFTDNDCGNLTLASNGTKGRTGSAAINDCWGR